MFRKADYLVRRFFAWPLLMLGVIVVECGGYLILAAAWIADISVNDVA